MSFKKEFISTQYNIGTPYCDKPKVILISADVTAMSAIKKATTSMAKIEQYAVIPDECTLYDWNVLIIDCRSKIAERKRLTGKWRSTKIPTIALIDLCNDKRKLIFKYGFDDYIAWPIIEKEISYRLELMLENKKYTFANIHARDTLVGRCIRHMIDSLDQKITLPLLCRFVGTNQTTLTHKFKQEFNATPMAWLKEQRLLRALQLLSTTTMPIINVSQMTGYPDPNNFATLFKSRFGLTPSQYRKINYSKE